MGFSIIGGEGGWLGILLALLGVPTLLVVLYFLFTAAKQARDGVVDEDTSGDGPIA